MWLVFEDDDYSRTVSNQRNMVNDGCCGLDKRVRRSQQMSLPFLQFD